MEQLRRLRGRLDGEPFSLPPWMDRLSERWWRLSPRVRVSIGVAAVLAVLAVAGLGAARSPWGAGVPVQVAARELPPGHVLTVEDLATDTWPQGLAPSQADLTGRRLRSLVPAGAPIRDDHLATGTVADALRPDRVAIPLPADALPPLEPGQTLDLLAGNVDGTGRVLARDAVVLSTTDEHLWVEVGRGESAAVAGAAARGDVTVALVRP